MLLRHLLTDRYAPAKGLKPRSVTIYLHSIEQLERHLGRAATLDDLHEDTLVAFLRWREATPHRVRGLPSRATVAKDRCQLLALADYAFRKKLIPEAPVVRPLRVPKRLPRGFTAEEVSRLIRAARQRKGKVAGLPAAWWWSTILHSAWCTAGRIGDLLAVRWRDVDSARCEIVFRAEGRKGHTRDIARRITPELARELEEHRGPDSSTVWPWDRLHTSLYPSMGLLCTAAAVPQRRFHALRKASASYVAAAGGDAVEHLDHSDPSITRDHYLDDRIVGRRAGLEFLPALDLGDDEAEFVPDPGEAA